MELMTHRQVAEAVLSKRADLGLGLTPVASEMRLDSIQFAVEDYDFVVERRRRSPYVGEFIRLLSNRAFQREVEATTPGISFTSNSGKIRDHSSVIVSSFSCV
jgi:molybdate-binding protein